LAVSDTDLPDAFAPFLFVPYVEWNAEALCASSVAHCWAALSSP
jgi:hypothetical protein